MVTAEGLLTAEEYRLLPDTGRLTELVQGKVVDMNMPAPRHGYFCSNIVGILRLHVREQGLGRVMCNASGVVTERGPDTVRGADVAFYSYARLPKERRCAADDGKGDEHSDRDLDAAAHKEVGAAEPVGEEYCGENDSENKAGLKVAGAERVHAVLRSARGRRCVTGHSSAY